MPGEETRPSASLLDMSQMCSKNGSSLPVAGYMRWIAQLQGISAIPYIYDRILLRLFRSVRDLGMEGDIERGRIHRELDAGQLCDAGRHIRHHWLGFGGIYGMAHPACFERADNHRMPGKNEVFEPIEEVDAAPARRTAS